MISRLKRFDLFGRLLLVIRGGIEVVVGMELESMCHLSVKWLR